MNHYNFGTYWILVPYCQYSIQYFAIPSGVCLSCLGVICLYSVSLGFTFGVPLATFQSALSLFVLFWDFFGLFSISLEFHLAPFQSFQLTTVGCCFICLHFTQSGLHLVWFEVHLVPFNQCGVHSAAADSAEWLQHTALVIYT